MATVKKPKEIEMAEVRDDSPGCEQFDSHHDQQQNYGDDRSVDNKLEQRK